MRRWPEKAARFPAAPKHACPVRQSTAFSLTPREIERLSGGSGDEEDGQAEEAARAARAARETLDRMWSSSAKDSNEHDGSEKLQLPELTGELEGEENRVFPPGFRWKCRDIWPKNPFPSSRERGAREAASASLYAITPGMRGPVIIIDIEVKQLDDEHREFEPDVMIHFVTEVGKRLAAFKGKTKIMLRGDQLAARASEILRVECDAGSQRENMEAVEAGIDPREDISFCSMRTPELDDEGDPDSMKEFAAVVAEKISEEELVMIVGPRSNADVIVMREVVKAARRRPVVLVNPRMTFMPREISEYETVYLLRQFNVQPIKTDPRKAARRSSCKITKRQRRRQAIFSELGQVVPKVLLARAFPDDFKLYLDIDGKGLRVKHAYFEKPDAPTICYMAQIDIEEAQRKMSMEAQMAAVNEKQREIMTTREENDDGDDVIVP